MILIGIFLLMDKYKFRTYLRFRHTAKGRHSIHSPFLWDLYETCITNTEKKFKNIGGKIKKSARIKNRLSKKTEFVNCLCKNKNYERILILDDASKYLLPDTIIVNHKNPQLVIINAENQILRTEESALEFLKKHGDAFILIDDIHNNTQATQNWNNISKHKTVSQCVNFYHFGLLTTDTDFTSQRFLLRF